MATVASTPTADPVGVHEKKQVRRQTPVKKDFFYHVLREKSVDTRRYRYVAVCKPDRIEIQRCPVSDLDTTAALGPWEVVKVLY